MDTFTPNYRPQVAIFSDPGGLAVSLVEKLLANFCKVSIFSKDGDGWRESIEHIAQKEFIEINENEAQPEYIIFFDLRLEAAESQYEKLASFYIKNPAKTLVVLPFSFNLSDSTRVSKIVRTIEGLGQDFGIIYIGDLIGPRISESDAGSLGRLLTDAIRKKSFPISHQEMTIFPVNISDAAREISKALFSFGPYGASLAIIGKPATGAEIYQRVKSYLPDIEVVYTKGEKRDEATAERKILKDQVPEQALKETIVWLTRFPKVAPSSKRKEGTEKARGIDKSFPKKFLVKIFLTFFAVFLIPYFFLVLSLAGIIFSAKLLREAKITKAEPTLMISSISSRLALGQLTLYSKTPFLGALFIGTKNFASLINRASLLGVAGLRTVKDASVLISKVLADEVYEPENLSQNLALELDWIYKESGFLQGEMASLSGPPVWLGGKIVTDKEIYNAREKILQIKRLVEEFPEIVGKGKPASYLILFQNNMELRPTGGFIGSFAIITFDGGRLTDMNVSDVYAADGQLKGHVEPPGPIKDYLGESNWYLRDSNWDPDFPTSAARAEWFLDKEVDKKVDGTIAVDLELAKSILKVVGPINLQDFNEAIDYKNLYEKTQGEVESNFFPGSYKKTNFLTALSRQLLSRISEAQEREYIPLAKTIFENLEQKHIQVFLHNQSSQRAISSLGFDGGVNLPSCTGNCYADWLGLVDANVGVNKANYFLDRKAYLAVYMDSERLKRILTVTLKNSANPALGDSGRYKTFLRVMLPQTAAVNDVQQVSGSSKEATAPILDETQGRKEAGILVEIGPGQSKEITFSWEEEIGLDFTKEGEYRLYIRKQAGTIGDKVEVSVFSPTLTQDGGYSYNTLLTRDFFSRIYWPNGQNSFRSQN
ncbi:MAG: DUF4012 domain-containing protein [Patescibacteria group bacterium]